MRKPLYNIVIFIFHIITLILLFTLCIHFNVIKLDLLDFSKEAVASFFKNDYVVNIVCTILTAAALYIIQIKYSKHKLKSDFRCNEIIHDVYDGIERTHELIKESKELSNEIEELEKDPNMDFNVYRKEEALKYLAFYKKHKGDFKICNIALTYPNNWICCRESNSFFLSTVFLEIGLPISIIHPNNLNVRLCVRSQVSFKWHTTTRKLLNIFQILVRCFSFALLRSICIFPAVLQYPI